MDIILYSISLFFLLSFIIGSTYMFFRALLKDKIGKIITISIAVIVANIAIIGYINEVAINKQRREIEMKMEKERKKRVEWWNNKIKGTLYDNEFFKY